MNLQRIAPDGAQFAISGVDEDVQQRCLLAKELEAAGEYEAAREALGDRWQRLGDRPNLEGLKDLIQAELLLRAGTLSGWIGSAQQIEGAQETAKDLISESVRLFEQQNLPERAADAQVDLAVCYWRSGALDEARVTLQEVLNRLGEKKCEPRLRSLANLALLERVAGRFSDALKIQTQAAPLFEESNNHALRGNFHNVCAQVLKELGLAEKRDDYIDQALMQYTAASFHFESAGHARFQGSIENNLGALFASIGRYTQAYDHLNNARSLFVKVKDKGNVARVDETWARSLLGEARYEEANKAIARAIRTFEEGDESSALAEALTTQGTVFARLGKCEDALSVFDRALTVAENAGDPHSKGLSTLALIEELSASVPVDTLRHYYQQAEASLAGVQNPGIRVRLGECARRMLKVENEAKTHLNVEPEPANEAIQLDKGRQSSEFSCALEDEVLRYEGDLIKRALENSGGSVTRAARLLGITHQGLAFILNGRHKSLLGARKPVKPRRRSIIRYH